MRLLLALLLMFGCLIFGCTEAPFSPEEHSIEGTWVGVSWVTYPGAADEPITESLGVHFTFNDDGTFIYGERVREPIMPPVIIYEGKYESSADSITLTVVYSHPDYSALHLEGSFGMTFFDDSVTFYQIIGDIWPTIHDVRLTPGDYQIPFNLLEGEWQGFSKLTYPGPADEDITDSLEIIMTFDDEGAFSYHWVGDEISFPVVYHGEYSLANDTVNLNNNNVLQFRTPLYLKGLFEISSNGDTLRLYQQPPHIWPDIYDLQLLRQSKAG